MSESQIYPPCPKCHWPTHKNVLKVLEGVCTVCFGASGLERHHWTPDEVYYTDEELKQAQEDPVQRPAHYQRDGIECLDAMRAAFGDEWVRIYAIVNVMKYLFRAKYKGKEEEDLKKALFYLRVAVGEDPRQ